MNRPTLIYRVSGTRPHNGARETVTVLRRTWPAARRAADRFEEQGRGPTTIELAEVAWQEVLR